MPVGRAGCGYSGGEEVPCVPVLVTDLLFHLGVSQGLQQRAPLVCVSCVPDGNLHGGQGVLTGMARGEKKVLVHRTAPGKAPGNHCLPLICQQRERWSQGLVVRSRPFLLPPPPPPSWAHFHAQLLRVTLLIGAAWEVPVTRASRQRARTSLATAVLPP